MSPRRAAAAAIAALVIGMWGAVLSELRARKRAYEHALRDRVESTDRYVDIGVILHTVVADTAGAELLPGKPPLRIVRTQRFGGIVDTRAVDASGELRPRLCGPSQHPVVWFCSEDQERILLHPAADPLGLLLYGSEGAGKSTALAMWHYFRWLEHIGEFREGGQTAPTKPRLKFVRDEILRLFPRRWYRRLVAEDVFVLCDGTRIQLRGAKQQNKDTGSPLQGFNWSWCGRDEGQDQIERHEDIENRGRSARNGRYKQLITATAKDSPSWRKFRDRLTTGRDQSGQPLWCRRTLLGVRSPFVPSSFWEAKKATMHAREYKRRILAEDVGPELQLYHTWLHGEAPTWEGNLRPVPADAVDITADVLAPWGRNLALLGGHDPGRIYDVTELLKAYQTPAQRRAGAWDWYVVGEVTTEQTTTEQHVTKVLEVVRERWNCNQVDRRGRPVVDGKQLFVRADPYSKSGAGEDRPSRDVYTVWRNFGVFIRAAAYMAATDRVKVEPIQKEARIDMMLRLLCDAGGRRRLYVACDARGEPAAPRLVEAFETSERDEAGKAETQRKDKRDPTHWPAATGYALWVLERPRLEEREAA